MDMNPDMQRVLANAVFSGRLPARTFHPGPRSYLHESPGALMETHAVVRRHMTCAAAVSQTWRKEFKRYLDKQLRNIAARTWRRAVQCGLRLCHVESYPRALEHATPEAWIPDWTEVEWRLRLGPTLRASLHFTRQRMGGRHVLLAQYALREDSAHGAAAAAAQVRKSEIKTMLVPDACWRRFPADADMDAELARWDALHAETFRLWLRVQRLELSMEGGGAGGTRVV